MPRHPSTWAGARLAWLALAAAALLAVGCAKQEPKIYSEVRLRPQVSVSPARKELKSALSIYVDTQIPDSPQLTRGEGLVVINVADYRKAIYTALEAAFHANFPGVTQATQNNPVGYQLVVIQAEVLELNQIAYHVVLVRNGQDLLEVSGKTRGAEVAKSTDRAKWQDEMQRSTVDAVTRALAGMAEGIYQQVFYNEKLKDQLF